MKQNNFNVDDLFSDSFKDAKKGVQKLLGFIIDIKKRCYPNNKNFEEHSLKLGANGLTTLPMPIYLNNDLKFMEIFIDLYSNYLNIVLDDRNWRIDLSKADLGSITDQFNSIYRKLPMQSGESFILQGEETQHLISSKNSGLLWSVLKTVYLNLLEFQSSLLKETSDINFWPHHFDLAMLMFSGNVIDGEDPVDWSSSREQMNFGFVFGDQNIDKPYLYVTIYPFKDDLLNLNLSDSAYWYTKEWKGAVLKLENRHFTKENRDIFNFFNEVRNLAPGQFYN